MIFAQAATDTLPIWTAGGASVVLILLGAAGRYLLTWFRETIKSQHDHEKALADGFKEHESKLADKWAIREKQSQETFAAHCKESITEIAIVSNQFDTTIKELHQAQARESAQTISTLLAIQKEMLSAMLALKQQADKLETQMGEVRRQVEVNGHEVKQFLRLIPEPKVDRVRKVPNQ